MINIVNDQEQLLKVLSRAIHAGWDKDIAAGFIQIIPEMFTDEYPEAKDSMVRSVLLEHGFAKAFWGEDEYTDRRLPETQWHAHAWQYHLHQAVLADDIIDYYYKHV